MEIGNDPDKERNNVTKMVISSMSDKIKELKDEVKRLREEISRLNKWEDNVREFFGDEAMMEFYEIYEGEEE